MPKTCPICKKPAAPETTPFCSVRCANLDLHHWLKGSYAIPSESKPDKETENEEDL